MPWRKQKAEHVAPATGLAQGTKHGHWSERQPNLALEEVEAVAEEAMRSCWESPTVSEFKKAINALPYALPKNRPELDHDLSISYLDAVARDGTTLPLKMYKRHDASTSSVLVLRLHGGGWVVGGHETEEAENRILAGIANVVLVSVDYRMAPEHPFPTAVDDSYDALVWCKNNAHSIGIDPERVILAGCSAGANLCAVLAIVARDNGITGILGQHLAIPVTCHPSLFDKVPGSDKYEFLSWAQNYHATMVDAPRMETFWDLYVGKKPQPDFRHSPLVCDDLSGLPPAMLQIAGRDPLRDEGIAYGEALTSSGVPTETIIYSGMPHGFSGFVQIPQAEDYYNHAARFVQQCASKGA